MKAKTMQNTTRTHTLFNSQITVSGNSFDGYTVRANNKTYNAQIFTDHKVRYYNENPPEQIHKLIVAILSDYTKLNLK